VGARPGAQSSASAYGCVPRAAIEVARSSRADGGEFLMDEKMNAFMVDVVMPVQQDLTFLFWKCLPGVLLVAVLYG